MKKWRADNIYKVSMDHQKLNAFHDELMKQIVHTALEKVKSESGLPPAHFAFFLMGSAGRAEQAIWSDQDHGIIFDGDKKDEQYFLKLGSEISEGFAICGYELCEGNVMASNPLWCKSLVDWEKQILNWFDEDSWTSIRNFTIFFDSRVLVGKHKLLEQLKEIAFNKLSHEKHLMNRLIDNVGRIKKTLGVFGQFLPEQYGEHAGAIHLKHAVFFPYVNALRLLAIYERVSDPSTLARFQKLPSNYDHSLKLYRRDFNNLLDFRLRSFENAKDYHDVHYLNIKSLSKSEREALKVIVKRGIKLFNETKLVIEKRGKNV
ncbi:DUF294 nucleotidyltransferase-like domain-containing protein [Evansella cellulosilytica]|uniref:DUF294 nucleotidyltransferase-like domain-containing protein n=1 Tax=Evansella cellulosilytica TaxID=1413 RepID=UPI0001C26CF4|nr:DUF294 nucleotidyltransferase-like domain-containing protein [Evansella cellulosilytica]